MYRPDTEKAHAVEDEQIREDERRPGRNNPPYLIPEALQGGYDTLVSIGGIQSNQTRQVAAVAAHLGLKCVLVQENWVNYSDAVYDRVGNIEMSRIMGADVRLVAVTLMATSGESQMLRRVQEMAQSDADERVRSQARRAAR